MDASFESNESDVLISSANASLAQRNRRPYDGNNDIQVSQCSDENKAGAIEIETLDAAAKLGVDQNPLSNELENSGELSIGVGIVEKIKSVVTEEINLSAEVTEVPRQIQTLYDSEDADDAMLSLSPASFAKVTRMEVQPNPAKSDKAVTENASSQNENTKQKMTPEMNEMKQVKIVLQRLDPSLLEKYRIWTPLPEDAHIEEPLTTTSSQIKSVNRNADGYITGVRKQRRKRAKKEASIKLSEKKETNELLTKAKDEEIGALKQRILDINLQLSSFLVDLSVQEQSGMSRDTISVASKCENVIKSVKKPEEKVGDHDKNAVSVPTARIELKEVKIILQRLKPSLLERYGTRTTNAETVRIPPSVPTYNKQSALLNSVDKKNVSSELCFSGTGNGEERELPHHISGLNSCQIGGNDQLCSTSALIFTLDELEDAEMGEYSEQHERIIISEDTSSHINDYVTYSPTFGRTSPNEREVAPSSEQITNLDVDMQHHISVSNIAVSSGIISTESSQKLAEADKPTLAVVSQADQQQSNQETNQINRLQSELNSQTSSIDCARRTPSSPSSSASNDTGSQSSSVYFNSADSGSSLRVSSTAAGGMENHGNPATINFEEVAELTSSNLDTNGYLSSSDLNVRCKNIHNNDINSASCSSTNASLGTASHGRGLVTLVQLNEMPSSALLSSTSTPATGSSPSLNTVPRKKKKRSPIAINDHITVLGGQPPMYQCNVCQKKFKSKFSVKYHNFCQNEGDKPFKCEQCGKGFIAKINYKCHLRTHRGERPFKCPTCGKGFNERGKVTRHMRSHTGEKPFVCQECNRGFAYAHVLRSHMLIHTGERPFGCTQCNKRFTLMSKLKNHVITHTGERPFICNHCGKSFGLKWALKEHMGTHSSERPYACGQCSKAFSSKKCLRQHLGVHSDERPYKCSICKTAFRWKSSLHTHIKTHYNQTKVASSERPYVCDQCSKAFSSEKILRQHRVVHLDERPYKCSICKTAFKRKDILNKHIQNQHNKPKEVATKLANEAAAEYLKQTTKNQSLGNIRLSKVQSIDIGISKGDQQELEPLNRGQEDKAGDHDKNGVSVRPGRIELKEVKIILQRLNPSQFPRYGTRTTNTKLVSIQQLVSTYNKQSALLKDVPLSDQTINVNTDVEIHGHNSVLNNSDSSGIINTESSQKLAEADAPFFPVFSQADQQFSKQSKHANQTNCLQSEASSLDSARATSSSPSSPASNDTGSQSSSVYLNSADSGSCLRVSSTAAGGMENCGNPATVNFEAVAELTSSNIDATGYLSSRDLNVGYKSIHNIDINSGSCSSTNASLGTASHGRCLVTLVQLSEMPSSALLSSTSTPATGSSPPPSLNTVPRKKKKRSPIAININDHITVLGGQPPMYQYNVCHKKFKTKENMKYHEFCKKDDKPFKCEQCGKGFSAKRYYNCHLRTHSGERAYVCPTCGKGFPRRENLTHHMRLHTGEKPFVCQECNRGFARVHHLRSHMLIHTGERPFACIFCNKRFTRRSSLNNHIVTHTGERCFSCNHCGKSFCSKWKLKVHMRRHSGERPYACGKCSKAFSYSSNLRRHLVVHLGPFKCSICGTTFKWKGHLHTHIQNQHKQPKEVATKLANEAAAEYLKQTTKNQLLGKISVPKVHSVVM